MTATGLIIAAAQLGLESIQIRPKRGIGQFKAQVVVREVHHDVLEITQHPVEMGASISDHAYKRPAELTIECGWSNSQTPKGFVAGVLGAATATVQGVQSLVTGNNVSQVRDIYAKLLALQETREPFDVYTGKRVYRNMVIQRLTTTTEKGTEQVLLVTVDLLQVLRVATQTVLINAPAANDQSNPKATQPIVGQGVKALLPAPSFNAGAATSLVKQTYFKG